MHFVGSLVRGTLILHWVGTVVVCVPHCTSQIFSTNFTTLDAVRSQCSESCPSNDFYFHVRNTLLAFARVAPQDVEPEIELGGARQLGPILLTPSHPAFSTHHRGQGAGKAESLHTLG
jgi:hypothetical protein